MFTFLDFEKPIAELENKIRDLKQLGSGESAVNLSDEVGKLETKLDKLLRTTYAKLDPWQKTQVARHPERPHFCDYIENLFTDFVPLSGDRTFGEDEAILGGPARFHGMPVMVIGQEKGFDTETRLKHNFGMARPEGYRKAIRLMKMADKFGLPIITLVDTSGAYPGVGAEERGQAEAIARSTEMCLRVSVPVISIILGEGGSGGAVAIAAGNKVLMMEHAVYSVISPEGCASILWRTAEKAEAAAKALKITAQDLLELGIIDEIIPEPVGGAHRDKKKAFAAFEEALSAALDDLTRLPGQKLKAMRRKKYLGMGTEGLL